MTTARIRRIAPMIFLSEDVMRTWFKNRRAKEKRLRKRQINSSKDKIKANHQHWHHHHNHLKYLWLSEDEESFAKVPADQRPGSATLQFIVVITSIIWVRTTVDGIKVAASSRWPSKPSLEEPMQPKMQPPHRLLSGLAIKAVGKKT